MGGSVSSVGLQVRRQALTEDASLVVSVVPDVSGIDRQFDYLVPGEVARGIDLGYRVRIPLGGREVSGWVIGIGGRSHGAPSELREILSVSGPSVEPDVVDLSTWVAERWYGSRRAVLKSASAPRTRQRAASGRRGRAAARKDSSIAGVARGALDAGGGLIVVPPLMSALGVVEEAARSGPVLVICPTHRMARLGAASLRRRGFTTAETPDQWEQARAGTDVVIGARSAVFAPCPGITAIIVVDEHDEAMKEERSPAWDALSVAMERGRRVGVPVIATSPVPSAAAAVALDSSTREIDGVGGWPAIVVEDLTDLPVKGSLLGRNLLEIATTVDASVACVVNSKGGARLLACAACGVLQLCIDCGQPLHRDAGGVLACSGCSRMHGTVCVTCGRTTLKVLKGGSAHFRRELAASIGRDVLEITAESDDVWVLGKIFVGTEAVLRRVSSVDAVVFVDVDGELSASRTGAMRDFLAHVVLAARMVGRGGRIVVQTRRPNLPLLQSFSEKDVSGALRSWLAGDVAARRAMSLPPFSRMARIRLSGAAQEMVVPEVPGVDVARTDDGLLLRAADVDALDLYVHAAREIGGREVRVHADPWRY